MFFFSASKEVGNVSHCSVEATDLHLLEVVDADVRHKCRIWKQVKCWLESGSRFKKSVFSPREAVHTFLSFCGVVLGGVGGLSHVGAGLGGHIGLHRFALPLSLFVTL